MVSECLVHLSDLHIGNKDSLTALGLAEVVCRGLKPRVLVVSGDFLDHPDEVELTKVRDRLQKLCADCGDCQLVVVPGNHDYKRYGLFAWKVDSAVFDRVFTPEWKQPRSVQMAGRVVTIFCFDSNTSDPRVNFARGRVGMREYERFHNDHDREKKAPAFESAFKLAVLHHHPLPIAASEDRAYFTTDAFLGLEDAGTFVNEMITKGIDLVLHGHKHFPFFARINGSAADGRERGTMIVAAGSASKVSPHPENSFNVVNFYPDGTVELLRYNRAVGGGFSVSGSPTALVGYDAVRSARFEAFRNEAPRWIALQAHTYVIDRFGDLTRSIEHREVTIPPAHGRLEKIDVERVSDTGFFAGFAVHSKSAGFNDPEFLERAERTEGQLHGAIVFRPPLDANRQAISYEESYRVFNAFALSQEQRFRMYGERGPEFIMVDIKEAAIKRLTICLQFPLASMPPRIVLDVGVDAETGWQSNDAETSWAQPFLNVSRLTGTVMLSIATPLGGHTYRISWSLPATTGGGADNAASEKDAQQQGEAEMIRRVLLDLDVTDRSRNVLQPLFHDALQDLAEIFPPAVAAQEVVDLGLMVYDPAINQLRYVAGSIREPFWDFRVHEGRGVPGRAHKLNQALLAVRRRMTDIENYGVQAPAGLEPPELQLCVPLRYPVAATDGWVVGVICLSTSALASPLLKLSGSEQTKTGMIAFLYDLYAEHILPRLNVGISVDSLAPQNQAENER